MIVDRTGDIISRYVANPDERTVESAIQQKETAKAIEEIFEEFKNYRQETQVNKIVEVIMALPKEETAAMAEALVELTSLRRKVDSPIESVGGATDVGIITKGDGFIWIKRKHYFSVDLNPDFGYRKRLKNAT